METVTISKKEYETLKASVAKLKRIDETVHDELSTAEIMMVQEKQPSFGFLHNQEEDIYTKKDLKEKWNEIKIPTAPRGGVLAMIFNVANPAR